MFKNLPCNEGDTDSTPGQETKIPHGMGQLKPHATTTEPLHSRACAPQQEKPVRHDGELTQPRKGNSIQMEPSHCSIRLQTLSHLRGFGLDNGPSVGWTGWAMLLCPLCTCWQGHWACSPGSRLLFSEASAPWISLSLGLSGPKALVETA